MRERTSKKSKRQEKEKQYTDDDVLSVFIAAKRNDNIQSYRLILEGQKRSKRAVLWFRKNSGATPVKFAERAQVISQVSGDRKILVIDPRTGHPDFIRRLISSFRPDSVYYKYKLTPINLEEALEIHRGTESAGTLFEEPTDKPGGQGEMGAGSEESIGDSERAVQDENTQGRS